MKTSIVLLFMLLAACDNKPLPPQVIVVQAPITPATNDYKSRVQKPEKTPLTQEMLSLVRQAAMGKCIDDGADLIACKCAADVFINNVNKSGFKYIEDVSAHPEKVEPTKEQISICLIARSRPGTEL